MIRVFYRRLRIWGRVELKVFPEGPDAQVLVHWDTGGETYIPVQDLEVKS